jgi:FkbM family methyltransferase
MKKVRIFFNWIRGYEFGDPSRNGEYRFLRSYLKSGMVIFDVGANIGDFTAQALSLKKDLEVHCFEPVTSTHSRLLERFPSSPAGAQLIINKVGLGDRQGEDLMKIYGECFGTNSLYERRSAIAAHPSFVTSKEETVTLTTLDAYVKESETDRIDLLKIDVEGHELNVLKGSVVSLATGIIRCIQFEYGGTFQDSGARLEDVFALLQGNGYVLHRLLPFGRIPVRTFHSRLENYKYSNWLAVLPA